MLDSHRQCRGIRSVAFVLLLSAYSKYCIYVNPQLPGSATASPVTAFPPPEDNVAAADAKMLFLQRFATEAGAESIRYAFEDLDEDCLFSTILPDNHRSQFVDQKNIP